MFETHYDAVWRTLCRLGVPDADVDDAAQKVFLVGASRLDDITRGEEGRYLYGVALRVASEARRRSPSRRETHDEQWLEALADETPSAEDALLAHEARSAIDEVLAEMPDDQREVFVLVEIEELTLPVVAELTNAPLGTATSRLRRARQSFEEGVRRFRARRLFESRQEVR
ncbi:MAG: sigma-70 family RNA polymerase sigma factor [Deltaproteobacteria bacterium]|nr:sigma-70 family RNA polymerase sigma factor [Deltaproteobacteria bacterium]